MQRITREQARKYAFDWRRRTAAARPARRDVRDRDLDASTGYFKIAGRQGHSRRCAPASTAPRRTPTPSAAPSIVEGAERGDTLVVTIEDILVGDYSWIAIGPRRGPLGESTRWPELSERLHDEDFPPHARAQRHAARRHAALQRTDLLADHAVHRHAGRGPGPRGDDQPRRPGRMGRQPRHPRRRPGNRIFLPIYHPGALFYLGDVHASQGDTEFTGTAAETKATVRLRLELIKGKRMPWMRIEKPSRSCPCTPTGRWKWPSRRRRSI